MPSVHPPRRFADYFGAEYEPPTPRWRAARRAELVAAQPERPEPPNERPNLPEALCRGVDPNDNPWYPDKHTHGHNTSRTYLAAVTHAKETCAICPEQRACLDWALEHDEHGIWGGTTDTERRLMQKPGQIAS